MNASVFILSLTTLALVILAGWISRKANLLGADDTRVLSAYVYNFGLPALFFIKLADLEITGVDPWLLIGSLLPLIILFFLVWILWVFRLLSKDNMALLGISVLFGSNAFFGIPFFESVYGEWGLERAVVTAALLGSFGITAALTLLEYVTREDKETSVLRRVLRSPLIVSIILGVGCSLAGIRIGFLFDALSLLGRAASGTAIFMVGMFVFDHYSWRNVRKALPYTLFRVLGLPAVTLGVIVVAGHADTQVNQFLFLQSGIPVAISIAIFAQRYRYKIEELTGVVVMTALLSFISLSLIYFLSGLWL